MKHCRQEDDNPDRRCSIVRHAHEIEVPLGSCGDGRGGHARGRRDKLNSPTGTRGIFHGRQTGGHIRFFDQATFKELRNIHVGSNPMTTPFSLGPQDGTRQSTETVFTATTPPRQFPRHLRPRATDIAGPRLLAVPGPHGIQSRFERHLARTCDISRIHPRRQRTRRSTVDAVIPTRARATGSRLRNGPASCMTNKTDRPFASASSTSRER